MEYTMQLAKEKLSLIADIWNDYILEYKFCNKKIKFSKDVKSNYFGDILRYFLDTFHLVYKNNKSKNFSNNIASSITFLQSIYIQQDFVEELLLMFKCGISKGDLQKDKTYAINRNIRNELIGHPIRKQDIEGSNQLLSSTIFSNSMTASNISYLRYHRDNNYKFEEIHHSKKDIIARHDIFLNHYFDIIIKKLKIILAQFHSTIIEIEQKASTIPFPSLINIVKCYFEPFFESNHLYKPAILLELCIKQHTHERYFNALALFKCELQISLKETRENIMDIREKSIESKISKKIGKSVVPKVIFVDYSNSKEDKLKIKDSFQYELGKLVNKNNIENFHLFCGILKKRCSNNPGILIELNNMENNLSNALEYYSSYYLVRKKLSN